MFCEFEKNNQAYLLAIVTMLINFSNFDLDVRIKLKYLIHWLIKCIEKVWQGFGRGGGTAGVASVRSC